MAKLPILIVPPARPRGRKRKVVDLGPLPLSADDVFSAADRGPTAFGYGRVSHIDSVEGESIPAQGSRTKDFWERQLKAQGVAWGGFFPEPGNVSAYKKDFQERSVGKYLMQVLRPGDHLVVDKLDRLWRKTRDFVNLAHYFKTSGIEFHIVNMMGATLSLNSMWGEKFLIDMTWHAEMEARIVSDRTKAALAFGVAEGYWKRSDTPPGTRIVGQRPRRKLAWDYTARAGMHDVVTLMDEMPWQECSQIMEELYCLANGFQFLPDKNWGRRYGTDRLNRFYVAEKAYRLVNHPMEVPWKTLRQCGAIRKMRKIEAPPLPRFANRPHPIRLLELSREEVASGKRASWPLLPGSKSAESAVSVEALPQLEHR